MAKIKLKRDISTALDNYAGPLGSLCVESDTGRLRVQDGQTLGGHVLNTSADLQSLQQQIASLGITGVEGLDAALSAKVASSLMGVADGVSTLNSSGTIPTEQLPSYVEDIIEVSGVAALPAAGEVGKLYVTTDASELYRWSQNQETFYQIAVSVETTDDLSEGNSNLLFTNQRNRDAFNSNGDIVYDSVNGVFSFTESVNSVEGYGGDVVVDSTDVGLGNVDNYPIATDQQAEQAVAADAYMSPKNARTFMVSTGMEVDEYGQWHLDPGDFKSLTGIGSTDLLAGDSTYGYYGTVSPSEAATVNEVIAASGLAVGETVNSGDYPFEWHKVTVGGKTLLVPNRGIRHTLSWNDLYMAGLVYNSTGYGEVVPAAVDSAAVQDTSITIDGYVYGIRLMTGAETNPTTMDDGGDTTISASSEWIKVFEPLTDGTWGNYTESELGLTGLNNSSGLGYTWLQETKGNNAVLRGRSGIELFLTRPIGDTSSRIWRPVLELM